MSSLQHSNRIITRQDQNRRSASWQESLILDHYRRPRAVLANALHAFRTSPEFDGVLLFNRFSCRIVIRNSPPWRSAANSTQWADNDDVLAADWLQHHGIHVSPAVAAQAAAAAASDNPFHPVRDYLDSLNWDGVDALGDLLPDYFGAERNAYTAAVSVRWLISLVARIYQPGCKADHCLILEGPQGIGKSSALRILGGEWFADELAELGTKDAALQTRGAWLIELAELEGMRDADVSKIKAFITRGTDRYREPYGRQLVEVPRQCVFAGTVNDSRYLRDQTGGRRFWPVACSRIDLKSLEGQRDRILAEAVGRFKRGDTWWLDSVELDALAKMEQSQRYEQDPWEEMIAPWLEHPRPRLGDDKRQAAPFNSSVARVSIKDILIHCIGKPPERWSRSDESRVGKYLRASGWKEFRIRTAQGQRRMFRRPT